MVNCNINVTNEYCYLGIIFVPSGSFTKAMNRLKEKALEAYFKIRHNLFDNSTKCGFKLFQTLVQPIIGYGCEVWSPFLLNKLNNSNFLSLCDKLPGESLHIKFCKGILGVHNKSTNHAVRGELGSFPLLIHMISLSIKYWWKLNVKCHKGSSDLVTDALIDNRRLHSSGTLSWSSGIFNCLKMINRLDIWDKPNVITLSNFDDIVHSGIKEVYSDLWVKQITCYQAKLRTFCLFKKTFSLENYVMMMNRSSRVSFCKLRISAHQLMIEKGRHFNIKPEDRICKLCDSNDVEDEFHFVMKCSFYNDLRVRLLDNFRSIYDFDSLSDRDIFILIMSVQDYDTIHQVIQFVNSSFDKRIMHDV